VLLEDLARLGVKLQRLEDRHLFAEAGHNTSRGT
jgi:hypothetical protein